MKRPVRTPAAPKRSPKPRHAPTAGYSGKTPIDKLGIRPGMGVDVKVCAFSDVPSGLKLVIPVAKR